MGLLDRFRSSPRGATPLPPGSISHADSMAGAIVSKASLIDRLRRFVVEESKGTLRADAIGPDEPLFESGYIDSLTTSALVAFVRAEYGVRIPDMDLLDRCSTLEALAGYVLARRGH